MIYFNDSHGNAICSGSVNTVFDLELGSKVFCAVANGPELVNAWFLLGRSGPPPRSTFVFIGDAAEELFVNWTPQEVAA